MTRKSRGASRVVSTGLALATLAGTTGLLAYRELEQREPAQDVTAAPDVAGPDFAVMSQELTDWERELLDYQADLAVAAEKLRVQAGNLQKRTQGRAVETSDGPRVAASKGQATPQADVPAPVLEAPVVVQEAPAAAPVPDAGTSDWTAPQQPDATTRAS